MQFTPSHEWIVCNGDIATIGITLYAQKELGEIVYVELPSVGASIKKGEEMAVLESTKAAADIYSPVTGIVIEINNELANDCVRINRSPEKEGWICKIQMQDSSEVSSLISKEQYQKLIG